MKKSISFLVILCISVYVFAQDNFVPGYVITNGNDTLPGYVDSRTDEINARQCKYKPTMKAETEVFAPGDIAGYRFEKEGKYYVSHQIDINGTAKKVFLEFMVKGIINLYYYYDGTQPYYFFENEDNEMVQITKKDIIEDNAIKTDNRYKGIIRYVFKDHEPIVNKADKLSFNQESMIKITKMYHDDVCTTGEECIIYENKRPDKLKLAWNFSVYTGIQNSVYMISIDYEYEYLKTASISPMLGVQFNLLNPNWFKSLSLQIDASISKFNNRGKDKMTYDSDETTYFEHQFKYNSYAFSGRAGLKYTFPFYKFRPTVESGFTYTNLFGNTDYTRKVEFIQRSTGEIFHSSSQDFMMKTRYYGYYIAAGLDYNVRKDQCVFIRCVFEGYKKKDYSQASPYDYIRTPHIKLGYTF